MVWTATLATLLLLLLSPISPAIGQPAAAGVTPAPDNAVSVWKTRHVGTFGGRKIAYSAVAELVPVAAEADGSSGASFFITSYCARPDRGTDRPVIFAFNGGPGSSSVWLHMKMLGPREVDLGDDLAPRTVPPFALRDNADSPLDVADIVLIDPPGTGYARLAAGTDPARYWGAKADARAFTRVIAGWLSRHGRWNSPRYLLGESYGTIRAALVADMMAGGGATGNMDGMSLNGVILIGQALTLGLDAGSDRHRATDLPALAASAWYHRAGSMGATSAAAAQAAADDFVRDGYLDALFLGNALPAEKRRDIASRIATLTGLSTAFVTRRDLRVSPADFAGEVLRGRDRVLGLYDARMTMQAGAADPDNLADDPAMGQLTPAFIAGLQGYLRDELGVRLDRPYVAIDFDRINAQWDYGQGKGVPNRVDYTANLAAAARRNTMLRLLFVSGRYDLVTTASEARYVVRHASLPTDRTTMLDLDAGHMPYIGPSRKTLADTIRRFVAPSR